MEVDETFIGGAKQGKQGRGAAGKSLVLIAAQCDGTRIGRIRLARIPDASGDSLGKALQETVDPGTVVLTDGWRGYANIESLGYAHEIISTAQNEIGEDMLPLCHQVASLLKRWMLGTHQGAISHEHLDYYLDEFTFRFNRRTSVLIRK